jgi:hypothetical protein
VNYRAFLSDDWQLVDRLLDSITVSLIEYDHQLTKLAESDLLPRYNRLRVEISNRSGIDLPTLVLCVRRNNSSIGADNYYTVPIATPELTAGSTCTYDVLSFDSFNEKFEGMSVDLADWQCMDKRQLSKAYLKRAVTITQFVRAA